MEQSFILTFIFTFQNSYTFDNPFIKKLGHWFVIANPTLIAQRKTTVLERIFSNVAGLQPPDFKFT